MIWVLLTIVSNMIIENIFVRAACYSRSNSNSVAAFATTSTTLSADQKTITFLRHGRTYMNEFLGGMDGGKRFGAPGFTDIFDEERRLRYYQDSPLSRIGRRQAQSLANIRPQFVETCELVVVSPLTRALQTYDIGLKPHFEGRDVPVVALPEAAERLYLISDVGRPVAQLRQEYDYVDFETEMLSKMSQENQPWWYRPPQREENNDIDDALHFFHHIEWRPNGQGQKYAVPGEPEHAFDDRMMRLYSWLKARPESHITVVCHHGVIDWMLDIDFDNCQYRQVPWTAILPNAMIRIQEQQELRQRTRYRKNII